MRKRYRVLLLAAIVAALIVPVGFALSLESDAGKIASHPPAVNATAKPTSVSTLVLMRTSNSPYGSIRPTLPEGARLFFVGTALFGLAAVMRRHHT
jgi:hypothetical protein